MTDTSRQTCHKLHIDTEYTSAPDHDSAQESWGQPPISQYDLSVHGEPIQGVYVTSPPARRLRLDPALAAEFAAWEAASDQDFTKFVEDLD